MRAARRPLVAIRDRQAKALRKGVTDSFGSRVRIQGCRQHKKRNVIDALPERMRAQVNSATSQAYASGEIERARQLLENLARKPGEQSSLKFRLLSDCY